MNKLALKRLLIRTPLEGPAKALQHRLSLRHWRKSPELLPLFFEDVMLDRAVERLVRPDSNCVDVGCHLGSMLSLLTRTAPDGKKIAFEPTPQSAAWLRKRFGDVDLREVAVAEEPGETTFHISTDVPGYSSLGASSAQGATEEVQVRVSTLDAELLDGDPIDFLKLDVEGAELAALRGGAAFFAKHRPKVQFECSTSTCEAFGYTPVDLFDLFTGEMDYAVLSLQGALTAELPTLPREVYAHMHTYPWGGFNYVALPNERLDELRA